MTVVAVLHCASLVDGVLCFCRFVVNPRFVVKVATASVVSCVQ